MAYRLRFDRGIDLPFSEGIEYETPELKAIIKRLSAAMAEISECDELLAKHAAEHNVSDVVDVDSEPIEQCPICGHAEMSDGYGVNDCPECGTRMTVRV